MHNAPSGPGRCLICLVFLASMPVVWAQGGGADSDVSENFLFLTGRVAHVDSTPPDKPIQLDLVCGGRVQQQVFTAENGNFSFSVEPRQEQNWMDASVGNDGALNRNSHWNSSINRDGVFAASRFKTFNLAGCRIQLSANQGYSANFIDLASRSVFDNPDVGVIVLSKGSSEGAQTVSITTLSAPPGAKKAFEKAILELSSEKPNRSKALKELAKATKEYPQFAEAWQLTGELRMEQNEPGAGREAFQEALQADPKFVKPYLALARLAMFEENWQEVVAVTDPLLAFSPGSPQGNYFNGLANFFLDNAEAAERALSSVKTGGYGAQYPIALLHLGILHTKKGRISEAAEEFSFYLRTMPSEQMPPGQKEQLERQLAVWRGQGLIPEQEAGNP